jgi:hypothetical protein
VLRKEPAVSDLTPEDAAAKLAEIRTVLGAFDWGSDDLQYALEQVDEIANRDSRPAGSPS